jgi:hypothetical protein
MREPSVARIYLAPVALLVAMVTGFASAWLIGAALFNPDFASDFENGTHTNQGGAPLPYLLGTAAVALVLGCVGTGRAAVCCRVLAALGIAALLAIRTST